MNVHGTFKQSREVCVMVKKAAKKKDEAPVKVPTISQELKSIAATLRQVAKDFDSMAKQMAKTE